MSKIAPRIMLEAPSIMLEELSIMVKAPSIILKAPCIMLEAPSIIRLNHLRLLWLFIEHYFSDVDILKSKLMMWHGSRHVFYPIKT